VERLRITFDQIGDLSGVENGSDNVIASFKKLLGELAAKPAADARNKPSSRCH
jgi:hypothetical protein